MYFSRKFKVRHSIFLIVFLIINCFWENLAAYPYKSTILDTPTAISLEKGEYHIDSFFYEEGSILFKFNIGINTFINLGGTEYVDHLIGREVPKPQIPNVSVRIRFTDKPVDSYNLAIGFDSLYHGTFSPIEEKLYGAYFVFTKGFMLFERPQLFSVGIRQPLLFEVIEPDVFASLYLDFFEYFNYALEVDGVHFNKQYNYYFILNQEFIFRPVQEIGIGFNLQMGLPYEEDATRKPSAVFSKEIRIYYQSFF